MNGLDSHLCCGGVGILFAVARGHPYNDFYIPIELRSNEVSDNPGCYALPYGFHEPGLPGDRHGQVNIELTIYREIFEELLGGKEVENDNSHINPDWFFSKSDSIRWLRDNKDQCTCEILSLGYTATSWEYELSVLFVVHDTEFWNCFGSEMVKNWESAHIRHLSTNNQQQITEMMLHPRWTAESLRIFAEGMIRLRELEPKRTVESNDIVTVNSILIHHFTAQADTQPAGLSSRATEFG
jgi:hypothetical protein